MGPLREGGASQGSHSAGATFAQGGAEPGWVPGSSAPRDTAAQKPSRGPGTAAMDIPPLAGKVAVLSLGALPLSYALNHVSALS